MHSNVSTKERNKRSGVFLDILKSEEDCKIGGLFGNSLSCWGVEDLNILCCAIVNAQVLIL